MQRVGVRLLQELLRLRLRPDARPSSFDSAHAREQAMRGEGARPKQLLTLLGAVALQRPYYHCRRCGLGLAPLD